MSDSQIPLPSRAAQYLVNLGLRSLIGLSLLLPYRWRVPLMGWLTTRIVAPLAGYRRRVRENLAHTCPDLPEAEVRRLMRAVPDNAGRTLIEFYSGKEFVARATAAPIEGPGLAIAERANAEGRPIVFVSAHMANYDAARAAMIRRGFDIGALYRPLSNRYFNTHYARAIAAIGEPLFVQGRRGMMELMRHLRQGGHLAIMTDLHVKEGVPLKFFGRDARTSLVPAELALKFNAVLLPVFVLRQKNGLDFLIIMQDEIPASDPETMMQEVNDRLEALVRDNTDQWFWIHRRWKNRAKRKVGADAARD